MSRALLLIDVDGPLNPWAAKPTRRPEGYTTLRLRPVGWEHAKHPLRVWLNPDHGPMLLRFAEEFDVELVWATTWMHDANRMLAPVLGLPELRVIDYTAHPGTIKGWKYPATLSFAEGMPLIWIDDDFGDLQRKPHRDKFMQDREAAGLPTKLHHIDPRVGLTELDLSQAGMWLKNMRESK